MTKKKRNSRKKQPAAISNTGFIGSVFIRTAELHKQKYYFSRKKLYMVHRVLHSLVQAASTLFVQHDVLAYISCVYLPEQRKIGFVLSVKPFTKAEGIAYFKNYLSERNLCSTKENELEIFNTGFVGVVFADLAEIERYTFELEMNILAKLMKDMIIPVKELFLRNKVPVYISSAELDDYKGFVLSIKPYDERTEADLYFQAYLKERGLYRDEEDEVDTIVIRKTAALM